MHCFVAVAEYKDSSLLEEDSECNGSVFELQKRLVIAVIQEKAVSEKRFHLTCGDEQNKK